MTRAMEPLPTSKPGDPRYPSTQQHLVLIELAKQHGWTYGAEIGVLKGKTLGALLEALPTLSMVGVDQWLQLPPSPEDGSETYARFDMAACRKRAQAVADKYPARAALFVGASVNVAKYFENEIFDFVFIDAGHTTLSVLADISAWAPKVKAGGCITGHDWWFPSVRAALDAAVPGWRRHDESVWSLPMSEYGFCK